LQRSPSSDFGRKVEELPISSSIGDHGLRPRWGRASKFALLCRQLE
jgi:hypothetical protein